MGWVKLPFAKLPEDESWIVSYRITADGEVEHLGYAMTSKVDKLIDTALSLADQHDNDIDQEFGGFGDTKTPEADAVRGAASDLRSSPASTETGDAQV